jgi:hypothetical protein
VALLEFLKRRSWIGCCAAGVLAGVLAGCGGGGSGGVTAPPADNSATPTPPTTPATGSVTVVLSADADEIGFGNTVAVHAKATSPSGATLTYAWKNIAAPSTTADATVKTPELAAVLAGTAAPASDPGGYYGKFTQEDRMGVLPINPDNRGPVTASVTVSDGVGTATASVTVNAAGIATGLRNVAVGQPVYLNSGHADPNAWTLASAPSGSKAVLAKATTRNASFTPDVAGKYTVQEGSRSMDIYAGTWAGAIGSGSEDAKGLPSVQPDSVCMVCHSVPAIAPDNFTAWAQTPHATFFATGVNGLTSNGATCVSCHTVGYDPAPLARNNGFDDVAKDNGWIYPAVRKIGNWLGMWTDPKAAPVARMANIQCESCHGPNVSDSHKTTKNVGLTGLRTSLDAAVCASCHASGTGHHNYSEWQQVDPDTGWGHSHSATGNASFTGSNSCARCHTAEGFLIYLGQLTGGNIGNLPASAMTSQVTADTAHAVTCAACHDPHDASISGVKYDNPSKPGAPSSSQLRVFNDTKLLPSGFSVTGFGSGALCVVCHNSRNGAQTGSSTATYLHEDGETYNGGNPTGYSAPHQAAQGDVFAGRNAYFLGAGAQPMMSKHANVEESCVGCHMTLNPQTHLSHGGVATSKHVFYIRDQDRPKLCANCHGATDGEALVTATEDALATLGDKMVSSVKSKLVAATPAAPVYFKNVYLVGSNGAIVQNSAGAEVQANFVYDGSNRYASVVNTEVHGQIGHTYTLTNPITVNVGGVNYTVKSFEVGIGSIYSNAAMTTNVYSLSGNMVRAGWNYYLIEGDQSKGIHNPSFANAVLKASIAKDLSN